MNSKELKAIGKNITKELRVISKKRGFKTIADLNIYTVKNNWFFDCIIHLSKATAALQCILSVKPMGLDEVFWDAFEISENSKAPMSLRSNGAYAAPTFPVGSFSISVTGVDIADIASSTLDWISSEVDMFSNLYCSSDISFFLKLVKEKGDFYNSTLMEILLLMLEKDYKSAIEILDEKIENGGRSGYVVASENFIKDFFEFAKDYCHQCL